MLRKRLLEVEIKVGIFVAAGVGLVAAAILLLGGADSLFQRHIKYNAYFNEVDGLIPGSKIILNGIRIGVVEKVGFDLSRREIRVDLQIDQKSADWIRLDTLAEIQTQGVLGDKFVSLSTQNLDEPLLPVGSEIKTRTTGNLKQFIDGGEQLMGSLNDIASSLGRILRSFERGGRNDELFGGLAKTASSLAEASHALKSQVSDMRIKSAVTHLDSILDKIDSGTGTVGALINDPSLYDDIKMLFGGANRNRVVRNLIRQTIKDGGKDSDKDGGKSIDSGKNETHPPEPQKEDRTTANP